MSEVGIGASPADRGDEERRRGRPLLESLGIRRFRSLEQVDLRPGPVGALVGAAGTGKSNLLAAVWALLDPRAPPTTADSPMGAGGEIRIWATLAHSRTISLEVGPTGGRRDGAGPPVLFLPGRLRGGTIVEEPVPGSGPAEAAARLFRRKLGELTRDGAGAAPTRSDATPALALLGGLESCCRDDVQGLVLLVEEPELYLHPHAQRYLYRLFERFAALGNQVLYSTHSPAFLSVGYLEELILVERDAGGVTTAVQPEPLAEDDELRALGEFDAERSELFLSRAAILVEGRTEKLVLPFVFDALGYDIDREGISVVDCRGKSNIPLFARVCEAVGISCVAVHDRDAPANEEPGSGEKVLNDRIRATLGEDLTVELAPDFEAVAGLRGREHKPARAWRYFRSLPGPDVPQPLAQIVTLALALAAGDTLTHGDRRERPRKEDPQSTTEPVDDL